MADEPDLVAMTIEVVANYVAHNTLAPDDLPGFIAKTHTAIKGLNEPAPEAPSEPAAPEFTPAVTVRKSLASREHILSLIDGKPYKTLKRHLSGHGLTPADYRARYGLKADYPMVAPAYSDHRREVARTLGLGRKVTGIRTASTAEPAPAVEPPAVATPAPPAPARKAPAVKTAAKRATPAPVVEAPATEAPVAETPAPAAADAVKPTRKPMAAKSSTGKTTPLAAVAEPTTEEPAVESVAAAPPVSPKPARKKAAPKTGKPLKAATPSKTARKTAKAPPTPSVETKTRKPRRAKADAAPAPTEN